MAAPRTTTKKKKTAAPATKAKLVKATVRVSIQAEGVTGGSAGLPRGAVTLAPNSGLKINVEKLSRALMRDQRARLVSSMGCVSNPGGPGC